MNGRLWPSFLSGFRGLSNTYRSHSTIRPYLPAFCRALALAAKPRGRAMGRKSLFTASNNCRHYGAGTDSCREIVREGGQYLPILHILSIG
jgi:hypothetical protein